MCTNQSEQFGRIAIIIGCGYLGKALASQLIQINAYEDIFGLVRSNNSATQLSELEIKSLIADVKQPLTLTVLQRLLDGNWGNTGVDIFYLIPGSQLSKIVYDFTERIIAVSLLTTRN